MLSPLGSFLVEVLYVKSQSHNYGKRNNVCSAYIDYGYMMRASWVKGQDVAVAEQSHVSDILRG